MLTYLLAGGCLLSSDRCNTEEILNICMRQGLVYRDLRISADGQKVSFSCSLYTCELICDICGRHGVAVVCERKWGIPVLLSKYRHRYGIAIGALLFCAILYLSQSFVWDVRVSGCNSISSDNVEALLAEQGFGVGTYIKGADIDRIENRLLIASDEVSWIAINLDGVVAYVEIREKRLKSEEEEKAPANLVASTDGKIESVLAYDGKPLVKQGEYVSRGQLLVSGIYDSNVEGYRYTRARGEVWARTVATFQIEIPLTFTEKRYTGEVKVQNSLIFFGNRIKLYKNSGFLGATYDTISRVDNCVLWGGIRLPVSVAREQHNAYCYEQMTRTSDEAMALAYERLDEMIAEYTNGGARLIGKKTEAVLGDDSYMLECTLTLIENIAKTVEFEVQ